MKNYFSLTEFFFPEDMENITAQQAIYVCELIKEYHLPELNKMREELRQPIIVNAGFRSYDWEIANGRTGSSQHCFVGKGAVDIAVEDYTLLDDLVDLAKLSGYKRVCYYPKKKFIHCDFKGDHFHYFIDESDGNSWKYQGKRR